MEEQAIQSQISALLKTNIAHSSPIDNTGLGETLHSLSTSEAYTVYLRYRFAWNIATTHYSTSSVQEQGDPNQAQLVSSVLVCVCIKETELSVQYLRRVFVHLNKFRHRHHWFKYTWASSGMYVRGSLRVRFNISLPGQGDPTLKGLVSSAGTHYI